MKSRLLLIVFVLSFGANAQVAKDSLTINNINFYNDRLET